MTSGVAGCCSHAGTRASLSNFFFMIKMAASAGENDPSIVVRNRGEGTNEERDSNMDRQIETQQNPAANQPAQQPQQQEGSPWKSMVVRMVIFWLVINFFRSKGPSTSNTDSSGNGQNQPSGPCVNLFRDGEFMVSSNPLNLFVCGWLSRRLQFFF